MTDGSGNGNVLVGSFGAEDERKMLSGVFMYVAIPLSCGSLREMRIMYSVVRKAGVHLHMEFYFLPPL